MVLPAIHMKSILNKIPRLSVLTEANTDIPSMTFTSLRRRLIIFSYYLVNVFLCTTRVPLQNNIRNLLAQKFKDSYLMISKELLLEL